MHNFKTTLNEYYALSSQQDEAVVFRDRLRTYYHSLKFNDSFHWLRTEKDFCLTFVAEGMQWEAQMEKLLQEQAPAFTQSPPASSSSWMPWSSSDHGVRSSREPFSSNAGERRVYFPGESIREARGRRSRWDERPRLEGESRSHSSHQGFPDRGHDRGRDRSWHHDRDDRRGRRRERSGERRESHPREVRDDRRNKGKREVKSQVVIPDRAGSRSSSRR